MAKADIQEQYGLFINGEDVYKRQQLAYLHTLQIHSLM